MFMFYRHYGIYGPRSAVGRSKEIRKENKTSPESTNASQTMGSEA